MTEIIFGLALIGAGLAVAFVLPILSMARTGRALRQIEALDARIRQLEATVAAAASRLSTAVPVAEPSATVAVPAVRATQPATAAPHGTMVEPPSAVPAADEQPVPVVPTPEGAPQIATDAPARSTPPARVPQAETLEARIGSRWLLYVGVAAIVIGASYFLKYAFDNEWITKTTQVLIGAVVGLAVVGAGVRFSSHGYPLYGQMLSGGGVAILYLCVYTAFNLYFLIERPAAFACMVATTAFGAILADRQRSQALALMAVVGGFATPAMIGGDVDAQVALFGYDAVLVGGTMYLAHRRAWPTLNLVSYLLTVATVASWAERFYTPAKYLTTEAFLTMFCAMFLFIRQANRRSSDTISLTVTQILTTVVPLYHFASVVVLFPHSVALLVYLIAFSVVTMMAVGRGESGAMRLVLFAVVVLPFFGWLEDHTGAAWRAPAAATILAVYAMHLVAQIDVAMRERISLSRSDVVLLHANGAALFMAAYALLENWAVGMMSALAAALALWNGGIAVFLRNANRPAALHYVALAAALATTALAIEFDGAWLSVGLAVEAAGLIWLAIREGRGWLRTGGLVLLGVAALRILEFHLADTPAAYTVLFNARVASSIAVIALMYVAALTRLRGPGGSGRTARREIATLIVAANILTITLVTAEIWSYWDLRRGVDSQARLGASVSLSVWWAAAAVALIIAGIRRRYAPVRYLAIVVFAITCLKVFLVDLAHLDRIYRIMSVVGLGVLLLVASYLYQRFGRSLADEDDQPPA